jgi:hypothetical protein
MAGFSTVNATHDIGNTVPPEMGTQHLRSTVDAVFGTPVKNPNYSLDGYSEQSKYTISLPEIFFGQNATNLGTRLVLQRLFDENFYTQVLAPITPIGWNDPLDIVWSQIDFDPQFPQITPEEGRTRIGGWKATSGGDSIQRWGMGFEMHHEALMTSMGQMLARGLMDQLQAGIQTHLNVGVLSEVIHSPDYIYEKERGTLTKNWKSAKVEQFFRRNKFHWGILQREELAEQFLENFIREEQRTFGGKTDSVLLHWKLRMYLKLVNPKFTEYYRIGSSALDRIEQGIDAPGTFGTHRAYIVRTFDIDKENGPLDLLKQTVV